MSNTLKILLSLLGIVSFNANAFECLKLNKNTVISIELKSNENFVNCFSLENIASDTLTTVQTATLDGVSSKIELYDLSIYGTAEYVAQYQSNTNGFSIFTTNTTDRNLGFRLFPTTHLGSNKNVKISHLEAEGTAQIVIFIEDINPPPPPPPPPETGECRWVRGQEVCNEVY